MDKKSKCDIHSKEKSIPLKNSLVTDDESGPSGPFLIFFMVFNVFSLALFGVIVYIIVSRSNQEFDIIKYDKSYQSPKDLKLQVKEQQVRLKQDLQHRVDMDVDIYGIMYKKHRDDPAIGDYKEIESVHDAINVLLGRNAGVRNSLQQKQMATERRRDGKDNAILYEPARNNHKFINHYYLDFFLMKQIKNDGNVQQSAHDTKRNTNKLMNALFDESAKNMPQAFQNNRFHFFQTLFLKNVKQKSNIYEVMANYHEKNEMNKNESIIDRDSFTLKKNEDKGNISIDKKKETLFNFGNIEEKENISDVGKRDDFLNTEGETDNNESMKSSQTIDSSKNSESSENSDK